VVSVRYVGLYNLGVENKTRGAEAICKWLNGSKNE